MFIIALRGVSYVVAAIFFGWLGYMVGGLKGAVTCVIVGLVIRFFFDVGAEISVKHIRNRWRHNPAEYLKSLSPSQRNIFDKFYVPLPVIPCIRTYFLFFEFFIWGFAFILFCRFAQLGNPDRFLNIVSEIRPWLAHIYKTYPLFAEYLASSDLSSDALHTAIAEVVVGGTFVGFLALIVLCIGCFVAGWREYIAHFKFIRQPLLITTDTIERGMRIFVFPILLAALAFFDATVSWGTDRFVYFNPNEIVSLQLNIPSTARTRNVYGIFTGAVFSLWMGLPFLLSSICFFIVRVTKFVDSAPIPTKDTGV